ncbi:DUF4082 domain-containing protein [Actinoplanes sp. CA-131856]
MDRARALIAAATATMLGAAVLIGLGPSAVSAACSPNDIVCENALAGTPSDEWDITGAGDDTIQGFATDMSVNAGETVTFKVRAEHAFTVEIFRIGYYGGAGARRITTLPTTYPAQNQNTACVDDDATQIYDCGTWAPSATWQVPSASVSGVYFALLTRTDGGSSHISFVVRNDASHSDVLFKTSDATWQAYNTYGGASFYGGPQGRATKLSYNRPFATRGAFDGRDFLFSNEYPMIRFLERNGYDVTYTTDVDADRRGALIANHKVFLSVGHDEYWSGPQRTFVEAARDSGTNLAFFSGNEVYWKTRWETSKDGSNTAYRTLVCYKETWDNRKSDPTEEWTGTWRDPRWSPPSNGGVPENSLTGTMFMANSDDITMEVPAAKGKNRFWRGTEVANQTSGVKQLAKHTIGYESDEDIDNGFRPAGLIRLSETTGPTPEYLRDFGQVVTPGTTTHHMTLYKAASGALVFGAGTVQYAWGLDDHHDSEWDIEPVDKNMQQAVINLFADMKVQPATRMSNLLAASASTDTTAPTAVITSPAAGATVANGSQVTVSGTASDTGGGVVAAVEVSLDNGTTWHPANGTTAWSYTGYVTGDGVATVKVRAADDSANLNANPTTRAVNLTGSTSLFGNKVPGTPASTDTGATEVGIKITPQTDGFIKAVRFYKGAGNTGTHTGSLWTEDGDLLSSGTFENETATGWQTLTLSPAVPVVAGSTYVASYTAPNGRYAADSWAFAYRALNAAPLTSPRSQDSGGNGVFGDPGEFPVRSYAATNYYVDVLFDSSSLTAPTVLTVTPTPDALYTPVSAQPAATFSKPVNAAAITFTLVNDAGANVAGTIDYDGPTRTARFVPAAALTAGETFTARVAASDTNGNAMAQPKVWKFTTDPAQTTVNSLFPAGATPDTAAVKDSRGTTLGVKFTPSADGTVIGIRFYKGTGNGGTHVGSLWSAAGSRLRQATFVNDSATGWQSVYFDEPYKVDAGTTYVASYYAPRGNYAATSGYFNSQRVNGPLTGVGGNNGLYTYGADVFPTSSYGNTNYWVDPMFVAAPEEPQPPQPTVPQGAVTVWPSTATPANASWNDSASISVGVQFTTDVAGVVNGIRYYRGAGNNGTHTGTLWNAAGDPLVTGTFVSETATGWQTMLFSQPYAITPGNVYTVSYATTTGHYAVTSGGLASATHNAPLHVPATGGVFKYGSGFPATRSSHNFWVDPVFTPNS